MNQYLEDRYELYARVGSEGRARERYGAEREVQVRYAKSRRKADEAALEQEGATLAKLRHESIPRVFGAGRSRSGEAALILEAHGEGRLLDSCQGRSAAHRLALVLSVAKGIAHAHRRLVAHGGIRECEIAVDQRGAVKILGFGRARGRLKDDVRALGGLLLEVLVDDRLPVGFLEAMNSREQLLEQVAERWNLTREAWKLLSGDLSWVIGASLAEGRGTFGSGAEIAEDLQRLVDGGRLRCRQGSLGYEIRVWARDRKGWAGAGAVGGVAGLLAIGGLALGVERALEARDAAQDSAFQALVARERAERTLSWVTEGFESPVDLEVVSVAAIVKATARRLVTRMDLGELEGEDATLLWQAALLQRHLGNFAESMELIERATALAESEELRMRAFHEQAALQFQRGDYVEGKTAAQEAAAVGRRLYREGRIGSGALADVVFRLAVISKFEDWHNARDLQKEALELWIEGDPFDVLDLARGFSGLGTTLREGGDLLSAARCMRKAFNLARSELPEDDPFLVTIVYNLAAVEGEMGRWTEAVPLLERVNRADAKRFGKMHPDYGTGILERARGLVEMGYWDDAEQLVVEARAIAEATEDDGAFLAMALLWEGILNTLRPTGDRNCSRLEDAQRLAEVDRLDSAGAVRSLIARAGCERSRGERQKASRSLETAEIRLAGWNGAAQERVLLHLERGRLLLEERKLPEALSDATSAAKLAEEGWGEESGLAAEALWLEGLCRRLEGETERGTELLESAARRFGELWGWDSPRLRQLLHEGGVELPEETRKRF